MAIKRLDQNGFTADQVRRQLLYEKGSRVDAVRYELWGATGYLRDLDFALISGQQSIEHIALGDIHGSFRFKMLNTPLTLKTYRETVLTDSPVIFYRMAEAAGAMADYSGGGRNATVNGAITRLQS